MAGVTVIRQARIGDDVGRVNAELTDAFAAMRDAVAAGRGVVVVLDDADLLGQGEVAGAALANGLLGLVRAFTLEGAKPGWHVNAVSFRGDDAPVDETIAGLEALPDLAGQLIRLGTAHVGKVSP